MDTLAVFRLAVLIADDAFPPIALAREWLLERWPSADTLFDVSEVRPTGQGQGQTARGHRVYQDGDYWVPVDPYRWSKLVTCVWCLSIWFAGLAVAGRAWFPEVWAPTAYLLALSAAAALVNTLRTGR